MNQFPSCINLATAFNCGREIINQNLEVSVFYDPINNIYLQLDKSSRLFRMSYQKCFEPKNFCHTRVYGTWRKY